MFPSGESSGDYELLDFGDGRRLERFDAITLDRPCPAAEALTRSRPELWASADAKFEGRDAERGEWTCCREPPDRWMVAFGHLQFELKRTDFGHLGIFPEQADNWRWIAERIHAANTVPMPQPPTDSQRFCVLNLFAYTGGSTLAAAAAGAEVVHVDAAKNIVAWARRNAAISGLSDAPIRWIVEDAVKFVKREIRRGRRYDAVILDPPSYGHGAHGEVWRLSKHLPRLLALCTELTAGRPAFVLLTAHTPGYDGAALCDMLAESFGGAGAAIGRPLAIRTAAGRELPSGAVAFWTNEAADGFRPTFAAPR